MGISRDGFNAMPSGQPRHCSGCGVKLRISKDTIWFRTYPVLESFCRQCWNKACYGS